MTVMGEDFVPSRNQIRRHHGTLPEQDDARMRRRFPNNKLAEVRIIRDDDSLVSSCDGEDVDILEKRPGSSGRPL